MTRQGWAEKIMNRRMISNYDDIAAALIAEHKRALRVVQELEGKAKSDSSYTTAEKDWVLAIYRGVRLALQRSRT